MEKVQSGKIQSGTIKVNYGIVYGEINRLKNAVTSDIVNKVDIEYRKIQQALNGVDGEARSTLSETLQKNRQKAIEAADVLDKLLRFISNSARQIEISEQQIARVMKIPRR